MIQQAYAIEYGPFEFVTDNQLSALALLVQSETLATHKLGPNYHLLCQILESKGLPVKSIQEEKP